jgi:hypothetical protein
MIMMHHDGVVKHEEDRLRAKNDQKYIRKEELPLINSKLRKWRINLDTKQVI